MRIHLLLIAVAIIHLGCQPDFKESDKKIIEGYRPIYVSKEQIQKIATQAPHPVKNAGKIYVWGNYIFVNEINKGIHIINNQQPSQPQNLAFISIPGNVDIAVKGNILYADNGPDLVALNISDPNNVSVVKRLSNVFPNSSFPPHTGVYFECVDPTRGIVAGWEKVMLTNPKCHR